MIRKATWGGGALGPWVSKQRVKQAGTEPIMWSFQIKRKKRPYEQLSRLRSGRYSQSVLFQDGVLLDSSDWPPTHCVAQTGFKLLAILLPQPLKC